MALNPSVKYSGRIKAPDANYTYGSSQDETSPGAGDGTPYEIDRANDIFGFQQALLRSAAIVPSGNPDTQLVSEYFQALTEQASGRATYYDDTGIVNALVADPRGAQQGTRHYFNGLTVKLFPAVTNTGATTINVASLGLQDIFLGGVALTGGEIVAGVELTLVYNTTDLRFNIIPNYHNWSNGLNFGVKTGVALRAIHIGGDAPGDSVIRLDSSVSGTNWEIGEIVSAGVFQIKELDTNTFPFTVKSSGATGINEINPQYPLHVTSTSYSLVNLECTDASTINAPNLHLYRNSPSPANGDFIGAIYFDGEDDAGNRTSYASIRGYIADVIDGVEDGLITFDTTVAGSWGQRMYVGQGLVVGVPSAGGDPGAGKINCVDVEVNGVSLTVGSTVTNHVAGGVIQIHEDYAPAAGFNLVGMVEAAWETIGITGSGADNIYTAMDVMPASATHVIFKVNSKITCSTLNTAFSSQVYMTGGDGVDVGASIKNLVARTELINRSGANETAGNLSGLVILPLDSNGTVRSRYDTNANVSVELDLYYVGFVQ